MNYLCLLGNKSEALRPDKKQHGSKKQVKRLAKMRHLTANCSFWFAVSHEKPDAKGLY